MSNEELVERIQHGINVQENLELLYTQNKGFIFNVCRMYRYACRSDYNGTPIIEMDELMNEAYFGLVEAAKRFDPDQWNTFLTYAEHWIRRAVKRFLDNSGQVIRVPVHMQEKVYKCNQITLYS
ncbi:MAG: polymerase, sigma 70 subunit, RpoD subfamily [Herbinix sp.]|jgi:RNA polymerase primary sigma factor|nr:polymerase, sigma 70 subunit, RpoD subfamily [Herbinix sp.]